MLISLVIGICSLVILPLASQEPPTTRESLPQLKQKLRHALFTALLPEKQAQREALYSLEKQLASGGDYREAIHARDQRILLEQEIAQTQQHLLNPPVIAHAAVDLPQSIPLENSVAQLNQLTLDPANNNRLSGWTTTESSATWTLPNLPPGGYEILLRYSLNPSSTPPVIQLKETLYHLPVALESTDNQPTSKKVGTLRISNGSGPLILSPLSISADQQLHIISLTLQPSAL
ncbi:hypothetical protein FEM03_04165 [Phragmitibacter flavus]|uniref:Uncharacterized protein n=1 Tax=Phragmitibacter flavus TaxID=2576071 RepID=A0A5R8KI37_9BACT|nr:hypothetical protein [Phragmitibacter flavus]TLD71927.1 hypothetical protein FEM03_04165 [Phragmitibacter flavus]